MSAHLGSTCAGTPGTPRGLRRSGRGRQLAFIALCGPSSAPSQVTTRADRGTTSLRGGIHPSCEEINLAKLVGL